MFKHLKTMVRHPQYSEPVAVDKDIAPLIRALWQIGINTDESCQNVGPGSVWILFSTGQDALKFLSAVATIRDMEEPDAANRLYFRMLNGEGGWKYDVVPWDLNLVFESHQEYGEFMGPPEMVLPVGVQFPIEDYFRVLHLIKRQQVV